MAARTCPQCATVLPVTVVVAYSDTLVCPKCGATLEVSTGSRLIATTLGLVAGWLVWSWSRHAQGMLGWVLAMVYGFLVFSLVSPLVLMFIADLHRRAAESVVEATSTAHASAHH